MISRPTARPLRVLLVSLPFQYFPWGNARRANYSRPPLGIAYLASWLRERAAVPLEVRCFDFLATPLTSRTAVRDRIVAWRPDIVGLSVMTATQPLAKWLTGEIVRLLPRTHVVAGGPHVTARPSEPFEGLSARIVGEGELSLLEYIQEVVAGGGNQRIPGVIRSLPGGQLQDGGPRSVLEDLDIIPFPAIDLLPLKAYYHTFPYRGVRRFATMMTSRGCAYACNFCASETIWHRRVRLHSVERVMAEIDHLVRRYGIDLLFFDDDTFTAHRDRTEHLLKRIRCEQPGLRWICHTRVDMVDDQLVAEMARSGCVEVQVGVESGDPQVMAGIGKGIDLSQAERAIRAFRRCGINVWGTFVLGHENETLASLVRTIWAAVRMNPTYASFIILLPFPGTAVFRSFERQGYLRTYDWADYSWHGRPVFATPALSADDLVRARAIANAVFYLRPTKLAELSARTLQSGSMREMYRNLAAWRSVVRFSPPAADPPGGNHPF